MSFEREQKTYGERVQDKARQRDRRNQREDVRAAIEECNFQLYRWTSDSPLIVASLTRDVLLPALAPDGHEDIQEYDQGTVGENPRWVWTSIDRFVRHPDQWFRKLSASRPSQKAVDVVVEAFRSLEIAAEESGLVKGDMTNSEPAFGSHLQLGEHLQQFEMTLTEPRIYTYDSGHPKTLFAGDTGQGKSATEESCAYDRYCSGFKVLDCVDMDKWENVCWDIPQQQQSLRKIREDGGLPADFTEDEDLKPPEVEILAPLTPGLSEKELPFDTCEGEFKIRPYTIPASDLPKEVLIKIMEADLSKQQRTTIRTAYEDVNRANKDWTLEDLQEEILQRDDLDDSYKIRAGKVLQDLARTGFIRSKDDPHTLDLAQIMRDTDTITVFGQSEIETEVGRLVAVAHLVDAIYRTRRQKNGLPKCLALFRELHEIVPQRNRRGLSERSQNLQEAVASRITKLLRKQRFYGLEVMGDTQYPSDVQKGVRDGFNRAIAFALNYDDLETLFEVTPSSKRAIDSCERSMTAAKGQGAVIGLSEPMVKRDNIEFLSPIKFFPSPTHHFDVDTDETGLLARCEYIEDEEMRRPVDVEGVEWDDSAGDIDGTKTDPESYDQDTNPFGWFCENCIDDDPVSEDVWLNADLLRDAYGVYAEEVGAPPTHENAHKFGSQLGEYCDLIRKREQSITYPKEGKSAYLGIRLTDKGKKYVL